MCVALPSACASLFSFSVVLAFACSSGAPDQDDAATTDAGSQEDVATQTDATPSDASKAPDVATDAPVTPSGLAIVTSFEGDVDQPGTGCGGACAYRNHPDMGIAVNGTQVVEVTGQNLTVFDYSGKILKQTAFATFMTSMNLTVGTVSDPRMTYDPFLSKWIVVCSCSTDYVMVSTTSDATGAWTGFALGVSSGDLTMWPGWDKNGVYISEFQAGSQPPYPYAVIALDPTLQHKTVFNNFPYESRPAMDPNPNKKTTDPEYFVARSGPVQNGTKVSFNVLVDSVTWSGTTAAQQAQKSVASPYFYNTPVDPAQPSGPPVKALESHRAFAAVVHNGHLHTVIASGPTQGVDVNQLFYWFDVDTSTMSLAQSAKIASATDGYLFPSLAVDAMGNVGMVATAIGPTTNPSVVLFGHQTSDPTGFVSAPLVAAKGTSPYTCMSTSPVGWGTYTNAFQDPSDPTKLWAVEEYSASAIDCQWHTRVIEFTP